MSMTTKQMTAIYSEDTYTTDMKGSNNVCQSSKHFLVDACGRWFSRVILLGAIMFTFAFNSNVSYAATTGGYVISVACNLPCPPDDPKCVCVTIDGVDKPGVRGGTTITTNASLVIDHYRDILKHPEVSSRRTNVFYIDSNASTETDIIGYGYIDVVAQYGINLKVNCLDIAIDTIADAYYICSEAIKIYDYQEWLAMGYYLANPEDYSNGMVIVYPNPVIEGSAFVKLDEEFLSNNNVQAVEYKLFGANQAFITTIPAAATSITGETVIPAEHISTHGVYFIKCTITILRDGEEITEVVDVPFLVRP